MDKTATKEKNRCESLDSKEYDDRKEQKNKKKIGKIVNEEGQMGGEIKGMK